MRGESIGIPLVVLSIASLFYMTLFTFHGYFFSFYTWLTIIILLIIGKFLIP